MKDTFYFSHDYNSRTDKKIRRLISKHGMTGYGIFWSLVEDLYQNDNKMPLDFDMYAQEMRVDKILIKAIICDSELFKVKENYFSSDSVARRLKSRKEKTDKAKKSAKARWEKDSDTMRSHNECNVNASQTDCEHNTIKGKERKGKEIDLNTTTTTTTIPADAGEVVPEVVDFTEMQIIDYFSKNIPDGADPVKEAKTFIQLNEIKNWRVAGGRQNWQKVVDLYIRKIKVKPIKSAKNGNRSTVNISKLKSASNLFNELREREALRVAQASQN